MQLNGTTCLVTGATNGIGKATALGLARLGATVVVVGRNRDKGAQVVSQIKHESKSAAVESMTADLSSMSAIQQLAREFRSQHSRLHLLINNAGALFLQRHLSPDGYEQTFALNHLSGFLLTHLLLDVLKASGHARIVTVSSGAHFQGHMNFDDLQGSRRYAGLPIYAQSKLANIMFTYELARRLSGTCVTANALDPGLVQSGFGHNNGLIARLYMALYQRTRGITAEQSAATVIYVATSPELTGVSGQYFANKHAVPSSSESYDQSAWARLWQMSEEMSRIKSIISSSDSGIGRGPTLQ